MMTRYVMSNTHQIGYFHSKFNEHYYLAYTTRHVYNGVVFAAHWDMNRECDIK